MNENNLEWNETFLELESFFRCGIENIVQYHQKKKDWKVEMSYLGEVWVSSLALCFEIFWRTSGFSDREDLLWEVQSKEETISYCLEVRDGKPERWYRIAENIPSASQKIVISYEALEKAAEQGKIALWLSIFQGKILEGQFQTLWNRLFSRVSLSLKGIHLLIHWFLPLSGMGILFFTEDEVLPWILYGSKVPYLKLKDRVCPEISWIEFAKKFRQENHLPLVLAFCIKKGSAWVKENNFLCLAPLYGKEWMISIPLEIHDLFQALPEILAFFPGEKIVRECHWDREKFLGLLCSYGQNAKKYLQEHPVYLELKDQKDSLVLQIDSQGIKEWKEKVVSEDFFSLNVGLLSTATDWLNETYLRLLSKFVEHIIPAEFSEKIKREEILLFLKVQNSKGEILDLFISGGYQQLPVREWQGDFQLALFSPKTKRLLHSEFLGNTSLFLSDRGKEYQIHFPMESCLSKVSLEFRHSHSHTIAWGLRKWISHTSLLSDIAPGLYGTCVLGQIQGHPEISLRHQNYRIFSATMLWNSLAGRILKHHGFVKNLTHTWTFPQESGHVRFSANACYEGIPDWWKTFVGLHEQGKFTLDSSSFRFSSLPSFPVWIEESRIAMPPESKIFPCQFWLFHAWAVPFDKQGNFLIRSRALVQMQKETGFAFLEFPCRIPDVQGKDFPLVIEMKKEKDSFFFLYHGKRIFSMDNVPWLKILKPGILWMGKYIASYFNENLSQVNHE